MARPSCFITWKVFFVWLLLASFFPWYIDGVSSHYRLDVMGVFRLLCMSGGAVEWGLEGSSNGTQPPRDELNVRLLRGEYSFILSFFCFVTCFSDSSLLGFEVLLAFAAFILFAGGERYLYACFFILFFSTLVSS